MSGALLGRHFLKNIGTTGFAVGFRALCFAVSFAILSRLVTPETMAAYGLAWAATMLGYTMSQAGAAQALVDIGRIKRGHRGAAFTITITIAFLIAIVIVLLSQRVAIFYDIPRLNEAFLYAAIFTPLMSLGSVDVAILQRRLRFSELARIQSFAVMLSALISVAITFAGYDLLGLFALQGTVGLFIFLFSRIKGLPSSFHSFTIVEVRDVWLPGKHLALASATAVISQQMPLFLIGRFVSAEVLGFYVLCLRIVQLLGSQIGLVVNSVLFPTLARMKNDRGRVGLAYLQSIRFTLLGLLAPMALLMSVPDAVLLIVAGDKWQSMPLVLVFLALMQALYSYGQGVFSVFRAMGLPSAAWRWNVLNTGLIVSAIWFTAQHSTDIIHYAAAMAATALTTFAAVAWLGSHVRITLNCYLMAIYPATFSWLTAIATGYLVDIWLVSAGIATPARYLATVIALTVSYFGIAMMLEPEVRTAVKRVVRLLKLSRVGL